MGYWFVKILAYPLIKLLWVGDVRGLGNIPKRGACIIAANHKSFLDFITPDEEKAVLNAMAQAEDYQYLSSIKKQLPEDFSWDKIKIVVAKLRRIQL